MFTEEQKFTQRWLWIIVLLSTLSMVGVFGHGLIEQLIFDRPWGDRPLSDTALVLVSGAIFLFVFAMVYLFYTLRLITEVRASGVYVRFYPFRGRTIRFEDIQSCEARTYRPLYEYGGWGIKYGRSGKAYNIRGDRGAQLILKDDKRILIGSQRADELATAIQSQLN